MLLQNIHFDIWWSREAASKKQDIRIEDIISKVSKPVTILAVNAPHMKKGYDETSMYMLARKIYLIFEVAKKLRSPIIYSGLLGGGAFRGSRPLVLLLHLLLHRHDCPADLRFHLPIFRSFSDVPTEELERMVEEGAFQMLDALRDSEPRPTTLREALDIILTWRPELSQDDRDLLNGVMEA